MHLILLSISGSMLAFVALIIAKLNGYIESWWTVFWIPPAIVIGGTVLAILPWYIVYSLIMFARS